jgi:hypothetical protein
VLDDDNRVVGLLQDGHELEAGEALAVLQGLETGSSLLRMAE